MFCGSLLWLLYLSNANSGCVSETFSKFGHCRKCVLDQWAAQLTDCQNYTAAPPRIPEYLSYLDMLSQEVKCDDAAVRTKSHFSAVDFPITRQINTTLYESHKIMFLFPQMWEVCADCVQSWTLLKHDNSICFHKISLKNIFDPSMMNCYFVWFSFKILHVKRLKEIIHILCGVVEAEVSRDTSVLQFTDPHHSESFRTVVTSFVLRCKISTRDYWIPVSRGRGILLSGTVVPKAIESNI